MHKQRYPDCQMGEQCDCEICSLSSYGQDCRNNPVNQMAWLRKQRGISQGQLAKLAGVTPMVISRLEREECSIEKTTLATVIKLADALGVTDLREML